MEPRLLFILKKRKIHGHGYTEFSSGLRNSVALLLPMFHRLRIGAQSIEVSDQNYVDAAITRHKPTHAIIEAFWVTPEKMRTLKRLHPKVRFLVRNHSATPFLALEGPAIGWIAEYLRQGTEVMSNSQKAQQDIFAIAHSTISDGCLATYGPNFYGLHERPIKQERHKHWINVGCFGAVRPLKNQLAQAIAALRLGESVSKPVHFHVNVSRPEQGGEPIIKNLRSLFEATPSHELIEHKWMDHHDFLQTLDHMDISMQVSMSESFNIVTADSVSRDVPVIVSKEIDWIGDYARADCTDPDSITEKLMEVYFDIRDREESDLLECRLVRQRYDLLVHNAHAEKSWLEWLNR